MRFPPHILYLGMNLKDIARRLCPGQEPENEERAVTALGSEAVVVEVGILRTNVVMTVAQLYSILKSSNIQVRLKGVEGDFTIRELDMKEVEDRIMVEVRGMYSDAIVSYRTMMPDPGIDADPKIVGETFYTSRLMDNVYMHEKICASEPMLTLDRYFRDREDGYDYGGIVLAGMACNADHLGLLSEDRNGDVVIKIERDSGCEHQWEFANNACMNLGLNSGKKIYITPSLRDTKFMTNFTVTVPKDIWEMHVGIYLDKDTRGGLIPAGLVPWTVAFRMFYAGMSMQGSTEKDTDNGRFYCSRAQMQVAMVALRESGYCVSVYPDYSVGGKPDSDCWLLEWSKSDPIRSMLRDCADMGEDAWNSCPIQHAYEYTPDSKDRVYEIKLPLTDTVYIGGMVV